MRYDPGFKRNLMITSGIHGMLVLAVCVAAVFEFRSCARHRQELIIPARFVLDVAADPSLFGDDSGSGAGKIEAKEPPPPLPVDGPQTYLKAEEKKTPPIRPPKAEKKPPSKGEDEFKKKPDASKRIKRPKQLTDVKPEHKTTLSPEELRKLFEQGARHSSRSSLSDADLRLAAKSGILFSQNGVAFTPDMLYNEVVRVTMYKAWNQPASVNIEGLTTTVQIEVGLDGTILDNRMQKGSGNAMMDESVMQAVQSVSRIEGLPPAFLEKNRRFTIAFELTSKEI